MVDVLRFRPATAGLVIEGHHSRAYGNFSAEEIALRVVNSRAALDKHRERPRRAKVHLGLGRQNFSAKMQPQRFLVDRLPGFRV